MRLFYDYYRRKALKCGEKPLQTRILYSLLRSYFVFRTFWSELSSHKKKMITTKMNLAIA